MKKKMFLLISLIFMFFMGFSNIEAKETGMCYYAQENAVSVLHINDNGKSASLEVLWADEKALKTEVKRDKISIQNWSSKEYGAVPIKDFVTKGSCPGAVMYVNDNWYAGDKAFAFETQDAAETFSKNANVKNLPKVIMDNAHTCGDTIKKYFSGKLSGHKISSTELVTLNQHYKTGGNSNSTLTVYERNDDAIWYLYSTTGYCGIFRETGDAIDTKFTGTGNSETDKTRAYSFDFPNHFSGKLVNIHVTARACTLNDLALGYACFGVEKYNIISGGGGGILDQPEPPKEEDKEDKYIGKCEYEDDGDDIAFKFYITPESEYRYDFINVPSLEKQENIKTLFNMKFNDALLPGGSVDGNIRYDDITIENNKVYYPNVSGDMYGDRRSEILFKSPGDKNLPDRDVYIVECKKEEIPVVPDEEPDEDIDTDIGDPVYGCEVIPEEIKEWIQDALNFVKYIALALVIILGALDFIKAAASGEADKMKKAGSSFLRRIIAVVILFLLPVIVDLILSLIEIYGADSTCIS